MKTRDVKIEFGDMYKKSKISKKEPGYYNTCTVSLLKGVPQEIGNEELIERWDKVSICPPGVLRQHFHFYELLDAEATAREDYKVSEHKKGDWAK
jgi:hypothetical protein